MVVIKSIFKGLGRLFFQPVFLLLLLLVSSGSGIYLLTQNRSISEELNQIRNDPETATQKELEALVEEVGDLMNLPKDEQPTLATVTDADSVRDQVFFANSENGDRVLIYTEAKKAILYRPSIGKIIEIAPVTIGQEDGLDQGEDVLGEEEVVVEDEKITLVRLALFNGTATTGLTKLASTDISKEVNSLQINVVSEVDVAKATNRTLVVVLSEGFNDVASEIANAISGTVGNLPEGEDRPDADILVILGSDYLN